VPACSERYERGIRLALERGGEIVTAVDLQARFGGTDWGLIEHARVVRLKQGPAGQAIEVTLKGLSPEAEQSGKPQGIGFWWQPQSLGRVTAACLAYSIFLPDDFDFAKGGRLPGLMGNATATADTQDRRGPSFSTRIAWRQGGQGDIQGHMAGWPDQRMLGNDLAPFTIPRGRWAAIEQEVVLNTLPRRDGLVRIWVDGELAYEKAGLAIRENMLGAINGVLAEVALAGPAPDGKAQKSQSLWLTPFELRWK
jgi:hypothetical protein